MRCWRRVPRRGGPGDGLQLRRGVCVYINHVHWVCCSVRVLHGVPGRELVQWRPGAASGMHVCRRLLLSSGGRNGVQCHGSRKRVLVRAVWHRQLMCRKCCTTGALRVQWRLLFERDHLQLVSRHGGNMLSLRCRTLLRRRPRATVAMFLPRRVLFASWTSDNVQRHRTFMRRVRYRQFMWGERRSAAAVRLHCGLLFLEHLQRVVCRDERRLSRVWRRQRVHWQCVASESMRMRGRVREPGTGVSRLHASDTHVLINWLRTRIRVHRRWVSTAGVHVLRWLCEQFIKHYSVCGHRRLLPCSRMRRGICVHGGHRPSSRVHVFCGPCVNFNQHNALRRREWHMSVGGLRRGQRVRGRVGAACRVHVCQRFCEYLNHYHRVCYHDRQLCRVQPGDCVRWWER